MCGKRCLQFQAGYRLSVQKEKGAYQTGPVFPGPFDVPYSGTGTDTWQRQYTCEPVVNIIAAEKRMIGNIGGITQNQQARQQNERQMKEKQGKFETLLGGNDEK